MSLLLPFNQFHQNMTYEGKRHHKIPEHKPNTGSYFHMVSCCLCQLQFTSDSGQLRAN